MKINLKKKPDEKKNTQEIITKRGKQKQKQKQKKK